ncbi:MAG: ribonuclease III [Candidatus Kapaibacterium sp.]
MKDIFQHIYNGLLRFKPLKETGKKQSNHRQKAPVVGFLDDNKKNALQDVLGLSIGNISWYEQALIHRSFLQVSDAEGLQSNERLEFLGDAVLGLVIADYLFATRDSLLEGELTKMRSWLVNKDSLVRCANDLGLDKFLMTSFAAEKALRQGSDAMLADAMEAVIAAIYLDAGIDEAKKFITKNMLPILSDKTTMSDTNYKSMLLEKIQALGKKPPVYEVMEEHGPDHNKEFTVGVYFDGKLAGKGNGKSKKQAEQAAARQALNKRVFSQK